MKTPFSVTVSPLVRRSSVTSTRTFDDDSALACAIGADCASAGPASSVPNAKISAPVSAPAVRLLSMNSPFPFYGGTLLPTRKRVKPAFASAPAFVSGLPPRGEQPGEVVELVAVEVGDHPVAHAAEREARDVEAVARDSADLRLSGRGPDEDIDDVLAPLVDQHRHRPAGGVIEPRAGELEAVLRQVRDRRRERQARAEPGLHRVLVRGGDVDEAAAERGAHVARHDFARQRIFGGRKLEQGTE